MFRGDHPDLNHTLGRALDLARAEGHPRTGSEHLLAALTTAPPAGPPATGPSTSRVVAELLARHGATTAALRDAAHLAAPLGAGGAADRSLLAPLGVDLDRLLGPGGGPVLDRPAGREPLLPLGAAKARER
ncbi:Clp protease N-terminal domain-containing protein, partial [Actinosynnema sp. NPDC023658]|uniref:Clp protease N-terminal domain-containing protein n=1 Tax=Actinosynnema sp. NPDC023658 TaxID=3155465 RepID=UPI0033C0159A